MLERAGLRFRIFEAAPSLRMPGLGLLLRPDAVQVLSDLGLGAQLALIGLPMTQVAGVTADGIVTETAACGRAAGAGMPQLSVHRGRLHRLMVDELRRRAGDDRIVADAALQDVSDSGEKVTVEFFDRRQNRPGGSTRGQGLVGADGVNSTTRARLYPGETPARWDGRIVWRGIGPGQAPRGGHCTVVIRDDGRRMTISPIRSIGGEPTLLSWTAELQKPREFQWSDPHWVPPGRVFELAEHFEDWRHDWLDVAEMIRGTEDVYEHPLLRRDALPRWARGRVALLGDAAHASFKLGSGGASDAILDALVLTRCLQEHDSTAAAFRGYEKQRRAELDQRGRESRLGAEALPHGALVSWHSVLAEAEELAAVSPPTQPTALPPALEAQEGIEPSLALAHVATFRGRAADSPGD
jgi:2-polyprenyl-6-methoxyphenol hydroxylase-like FAD-dependent oxidoreductase